MRSACCRARARNHRCCPPTACSIAHDDTWRALLQPTGELDAEGASIFELSAAPHDSGQFSYEIRIYPWHELLTQPLELGLLKRL